jgi:hypothetical protein
MSLGFQVANFLGGELFTLDVNDRRLYTMATSGSTKTFRAYSLDTLALVGTDVLTGVPGNPNSLIRLGSNAMAFRTSADQVVIFKSPAIVPEPTSWLLAGSAFALLVRRRCGLLRKRGRITSARRRRTAACGTGDRGGDGEAEVSVVSA